MSQQVVESLSQKIVTGRKKFSHPSYNPWHAEKLQKPTSYAIKVEVVDYNTARNSRTVGSQRFFIRPESETLSEVEFIDSSLADIRMLEPDWDANGALMPREENISFAGEFLRKASNVIGIKKTGEAEINPVPNGSVDVVWRTGKGHLLINFRQPEKGIAHYYFDQYDEQLGRQGAFRVDEPLPADLKIHLKSL